jgi:hypothetical protein
MTINIDNIIYYTGVISILNLAKNVIIKITPEIIKNKFYNISYDLGLSGLVIAGNTINIISKFKKKFQKNVDLINLTEIKTEYYELKFKSYNINNSIYVQIINNDILDIISDEDNVIIDNNVIISDEELDENSPLLKKNKNINIVNPFLSIILNYNNKDYDILENMNNYMIEKNEFTHNFFIWFMDEFFKIKMKNDYFKITLVERKNFDIKTYDKEFIIKI